jgi:predicted MPP superfamily phosphohydrolase
VQISDIHYGQWISLDRLIGVVGLINQQEPDIVAITGDFVSYSQSGESGESDIH